jgi:nitroreductase
MTAYEAITSRRSVRKFKQDPIEIEILKKLVDCARLAPNGANRQPLRFGIVSDKKNVDAIFGTVAWAAAIHPEGDPKPGEEPVAYIVILADRKMYPNGSFDVDHGAAGQSILIAAQGEGLGSCWLGAIKRNKIKEILDIDEDLDVLTMIALGYPAEFPIIEDINDNEIKYYKDESGVLHVPKRTILDVTAFLE